MAYRAYDKIANIMGETNYRNSRFSTRPLFFIKYAQNFCEIMRPEVASLWSKTLTFSPGKWSISAALLLVDLGADNETDKQIRTALGVGGISKIDVHEKYRQLESVLKAGTSGKISLSVANGIFTKLGVLVRETYKVNSKQYYGSGVELLDFLGEPEKSRQHINKWVEDRTEGKIRNLVPSGAIESSSLLVLVNAIYFKGKWLYAFEKYDTRNDVFHLNKQNQATVKMMNGKKRVKYILDDVAQYSAVELPYKDSDIAMVFILPKQLEGLPDIEKQLNQTFMTRVFKTLKQAERPEVILKIPKFKMESSYQLEKDLPNIGIMNMFDVEAADFSVMLPGSSDAYISSAIHKAFVAVDEEGTEAAAVTAVEMMLERGFSLQRPKEFIADHPFIFLIRDTQSDAVLFMGRYVTPPV